MPRKGRLPICRLRKVPPIDYVTRAVLNSVVAFKILDYLTSPDLCRLLRVSKTFHRLVTETLPLLYNIRHQLQKYFRNVDGFRRLQSNTGSIISGSFALQFFLRCSWADTGLDLFVTHGAVLKVAKWLTRNDYQFVPPKSGASGDGYQEVFEAIEDTLEDDGYAGKLDFVRTVGNDKEKKKLAVQLFVVYGSPMQAILNFHSTCVMNVITYEKAYCLYAKATLRANISLALREIDEDTLKAMGKYERRGYQFRRLVPVHIPYLFQETDVRWMGDAHVFSVKLLKVSRSSGLKDEPKDEPTSHGRIDPVATTSWTIATYPMDYHRVHFYHVNHEACIVPLVVAHQFIQCWLEDNIGENDYVKYGWQDGSTSSGKDRASQQVLKDLMTYYHNQCHCVSPGRKFLEY